MKYLRRTSATTNTALSSFSIATIWLSLNYPFLIGFLLN
jgi:hypothetical protein